MSYLQCARRECLSISPVIDTERDVYYVFGGGDACINCQACAESRGWHLLRDPVMLAQIQRKPRPPPDPDDIVVDERREPPSISSTVATGIAAGTEEMDVEEWNAALYNQLVAMSVAEFRLFLERGHAKQVMAPETARRLGELLLWLGAQQPPDMHAIVQALCWWPKLFYGEDWPQQIHECYNRCLHQFLTNIIEEHQQWCIYCGCQVSECVNNLVAHASLLSLLCEENSVLWQQCTRASVNTKATTHLDPRASIVWEDPVNHVDLRQNDTPKPWWWIQQQQQGHYGATDCVENVV